jgi:hypothetical protein
MELKKLERERREIADAEKEDKERERRRRRNRQQDDDMLEMGNTNSFHAFNGKETEPYQMEMEVARKRVRKDPEESKANKVEVIDLSDESDSEQQEMVWKYFNPNNLFFSQLSLQNLMQQTLIYSASFVVKILSIQFNTFIILLDMQITSDAVQFASLLRAKNITLNMYYMLWII